MGVKSRNLVSILIGSYSRYLDGVSIFHPAVSRQHARIIRNQGNYLIEDLESTNGIYLNKVRIISRYLKDGDIINIGRHTLVVSIKTENDKNPTYSLIKTQNDKNPTGLIEGLELTLGGLITTLEKAGLKEIEAEGKPFDPNFHEAISQQGDDKVAPGLVITEIQKGYLLNGRLIRPSMVVVSQGNTNKRKEMV